MSVWMIVSLMRYSFYNSHDSDAMTTNPTFELSFSPPVGWTTADTSATSGPTSSSVSSQAIDITEATKNAQNDIRLNVILKFKCCIITQFSFS